MNNPPKKSGKLTPIKNVGIDNNGNVIWLCLCDCGKETKVTRHSLNTNHTKSCGCLRYTHNSRLTHNESNCKTSKGTKEYRAWRAMLNRCYLTTHTRYHRYGGRGITVCDKWRASYTDFLDDVGRAPSPKHSLDRINNNGNYEPGNVRWATAKEQATNRTNPTNPYVWAWIKP